MTTQPNRLIAVHLLNDWSGSPLVFRQALEALHADHRTIRLYTATPGGSGFLSNLPGVAEHPLAYRWSPSKLLTLLYFLRTQLYLFGHLLLSLRATDTVYVNTLLPFGAALAGWLRGCSVVYHVHEVSLKPVLLRRFLLAVANRTAGQVIFVSHYAAAQLPLPRPQRRVVHNALPAQFTQQADRIITPAIQPPFTVLMLCSNKAYKGVNEFIGCARQLPRLRFLLVLNTTPADVEHLREQALPPDNCLLFSAQADTIPFYRQAHVVLNLSRPDGWVETFGMTVLEALCCGRPVIVPPVGGVCELITDGKEGFAVDSRDQPALVAALTRLSSDMDLYLRLAKAARRRATTFSTSQYNQQITTLFRRLTPTPTAITAQGAVLQSNVYE